MCSAVVHILTNLFLVWRWSRTWGFVAVLVCPCAAVKTEGCRGWCWEGWGGNGTLSLWLWTQSTHEKEKDVHLLQGCLCTLLPQRSAFVQVPCAIRSETNHFLSHVLCNLLLYKWLRIPRFYSGWCWIPTRVLFWLSSWMWRIQAGRNNQRWVWLELEVLKCQLFSFQIKK